MRTSLVASVAGLRGLDGKRLVGSDLLLPVLEGARTLESAGLERRLLGSRLFALRAWPLLRLRLLLLSYRNLRIRSVPT